MKVFFGLLMMAIIITTSINSDVYAMDREGSEISEAEETHESRINELFEERSYLILNSIEARNLQNCDDNIQQYSVLESNRLELIDHELSELGIRKIDPDNVDDMNYLREMPLSSENGEIIQVSGIYDTAPNLSMIAQLYDIYIDDGSVEPFYDGTEEGKKSYQFRRIRVVDKLTGNRLYKRQRTTLITKQQVINNSIMAILKYNFRYGMSMFMGIMPGGVLVDWALGNFEALAGATSENITISNDNVYEISFSSSTTMYYYYLYNNGWKLIGTGTTAKMLRNDYFLGQIDRKPVEEHLHEESFSITDNGTTLRQYVKEYVTKMNQNPYYHKVCSIGTLTVEGYEGKSTKFSPKFAEEPNDLLRY